MKLDRAALDYLLVVAKDIGYRVIKLQTTEDYLFEPQITITFAQSREARDTMETPVEALERLRKTSQDVRAGVTEEQAAEIAGKGLSQFGTDKFKTLNDT